MWQSLRVKGSVTRHVAQTLLTAFLTLVCAPLVMAQSDLPLIFNASEQADAGEIVWFQGSNFGADPQVFIERPDGTLSEPLDRVSQWGGIWVAAHLPSGFNDAVRLRVRTAAGMSDMHTLNAPIAHHLDALEISPGGAVRLFGRNLLRPGFIPHVTINGQTATINIKDSDAYQLRITSPATLQANDVAVFQIDNGNGSYPVRLPRPVKIIQGGVDIWKLGVGWAGGFAELTQHMVQARGPNAIPVATAIRCDGIADDTATIQHALDQLQTTGGGVLQLSAGVCQINGSIQLRSNTVLQGEGMDKTTLQYSSDYPLIGRQLDRVAVRNLTLKNVTGAVESPLIQNSRRVVLQNVRFELGGGVHMFLTGNQDIALVGCVIHQPANSHGNGPVILNDNAGLTMAFNEIQFTHGAPSLARVHDAYVSDNRFTRMATETPFPRTVVHSLAIDFAHHIAIIRNRFEVQGGPVVDKFRNDGEALLTEGGGGDRTEWTGNVQAATDNSISDISFQMLPAIGRQQTLPENFGIAIVGGKGAGQQRRIVERSGTTLKVDPPWQQVPDRSSRYATFLWGLEKSLIQHNIFDANPRGIWLYQTAVRDVAIDHNQILNGGGIYLRTAQNLSQHLFTPMVNVQITGNQISNTNREWPAYITSQFVRMDGEDFGLATIGVEVIGNVIQTQQPNLKMPQEEAGAFEGFAVRMHAEGATQSINRDQTRLLGTILQRNQCVGCEAPIRIRDGARGTVLESNHGSIPATP